MLVTEASIRYHMFDGGGVEGFFRVHRERECEGRGGERWDGCRKPVERKSARIGEGQTMCFLLEALCYSRACHWTILSEVRKRLDCVL